MKFGIRKPSLRKRVAARTSWRRCVRHSIGIKVPKGYGWITNPKRAAYNRVYNKTTVKADVVIVIVFILVLRLLIQIFNIIVSIFSNLRSVSSAYPLLGDVTEKAINVACPRCSSAMVLKNGRYGKFYGCLRFPRCRGAVNPANSSKL